MSNASPVVNESSYLTLHYRLAVAGGADIVTTFNGTPATLMLGQGQLAPFLEQRLLGLPEGTHQTFELSALEAFGDRNPELIQAVSKTTLEQNSVPGADYAVGREHQGVAGGDVVQLFDEDRALVAQVFDHVGVVHDLVAHVDRRAELFQGALDDLDRTVHAGAEAARLGSQDFIFHIVSIREPKSVSLRIAGAGLRADG